MISVSPWLHQRAARSPFFADKRCKVILNGIDTDLFTATDADTCASTKTVLHVSPYFTDAPQHIKGGRYLLELARRLPNVHFVVAGQYQQGLSLPANVTLLGNIGDARQLARLYAQADVTLLTSKAETFSMVVAESLCCGTPVVGFRAGAPEQIALPDFSTFVPYGDTDALCSALLARLAQSPERGQIVEAARQKYAKQRMCEQYLAAYQQIKK